jgi:hypothetical protein
MIFHRKYNFSQKILKYFHNNYGIKFINENTIYKKIESNILDLELIYNIKANSVFKIDGKYFRLKQTDYDQKFELFPIKYFDSEMCLNYDHFIYYNQDKRTIIWNLVSDNYYFELIDYTGRVYLSGVTDLNYINTDKLNDGVYIFKLKVNGVHYIKKIVIKKL